MRYAGLKYNDTVNGEGICVSFWTQGCPHHCKDCHNSETWSYEGGYAAPADLKWKIIDAIKANGIARNFSVLGGEPLAETNLPFVNQIVHAVRIAYPNIKIFLWTGYTVEYLQEKRKENTDLDQILKNVDILIDGLYVAEKRDITLKLRGSTNQRILCKGQDF